MGNFSKVRIPFRKPNMTNNHDEDDEEQLTCEKRCTKCQEDCNNSCAECQKDCNEFCFTPATDKSPALYCLNTPMGHAQLAGFLLVIYLFDALFFALLLHLEVKFGLDVLWGFFGLFLAGIVVLTIVVIIGTSVQLENEEKERTTRASLKQLELAAGMETKKDEKKEADNKTGDVENV